MDNALTPEILAGVIARAYGLRDLAEARGDEGMAARFAERIQRLEVLAEQMREGQPA